MTKEQFMALQDWAKRALLMDKKAAKVINKLFFTGQRGDGLRLPVGGTRTPRVRMYEERKKAKNV